MKFLTDFLRRIKSIRRRPSEAEVSLDEPEAPTTPQGPEAPEELSEKPGRWQKFKTAKGVVWGVPIAIVVVAGFVLWRFLFSGTPLPEKTRASGEAEFLPLSDLEKDLFRAIRDDDAEGVRRCLNSGADVSAADGSGGTPIKTAIALNRVDAVRALLDAGYDDSRGGGSSLIYAIVLNRTEITRELLKAAAERGTARETVNQIDKNGRAPLMYAVDRNHVTVAQALLNAGADVNELDKEGYTPLMRAVTVGKADMVAALLEAGADMGVASPGGETAMSIARRRNKQVVVSLLLDAARVETPLPLGERGALDRKEAL
ncbi:MAG: ankyrin repeat domain-containing protein [Synergistaceae bacterium]|jgi:hypothetical protein|nr:ankyrin repeat domain-containing protein [Synergistaceae bacterium]